VRAGWLARNDMRVLGQFVLRFALPALLFTMLARRSVAEIFDARYLLAYLGGSLIALAFGWFYERRKGASYRAFVGMGMSFSNSGYVGVPVLLPWLGTPAAVAIALTMIVENLVMLPLVLTLAERDSARRASVAAALREVAMTLLRHPLVIAIVAGIVVAAFAVVLPAPLQRAIDMMAQASAGVALFVIGGSLVGLHLAGVKQDLAAVAIGKLVLHPLAVAALAWWLLADNTVLRTAAIALAAMPMLGIYPVLAQKHGHDAFCAAALLVTTVASFFTLSGLLWWLS
jgi:malonate transporter and related proteins